MILRTFKARFILPVSIAVVALVATGTFLLSQYLNDRETQSVASAISHEVASLTQVMNVTAALMDDRALSGLELLKGRIFDSGTVRIGKEIELSGVNVNEILIGGRSQLSNFDIVDDLTRSIGGTASIYSLRNSEFMRVSTNVKKSNGIRGTGTPLDPSTKAYQSLIQGRAYYGITEILGKKYFSAYEPLHDDRGEVIGAMYFGYLADFSVVQKAVDTAKILASGYLAVVDSEGSIRYKKNTISSAETELLVKGDISGWEITRHVIPAWDYTVVVGYPTEELNAPVAKVALILLLGGGVMAIVISLVIYFLLEANVVSLLGGEPRRAAEYMRSIAAGDLSQEIITKDGDEKSMMASMRAMQLKLKNITRSIQVPMTDVISRASKLEREMDSVTTVDGDVNTTRLDELKCDVKEVLAAAHILQRAINRLRM